MSISTIDKEQIDDMKHALGLNYKNEMWRNHFYTKSDNRLWNDLVEKGYAQKREGWESDTAYFCVTEKGKAMLRRLLNQNKFMLEFPKDGI